MKAPQMRPRNDVVATLSRHGWQTETIWHSLRPVSQKGSTMSGFLSQIVGGLMGGGGGGLAQALPGLLTQLVGNAQGAAGGGLPALLAQFENAGLGPQVASWVGPGENLPITAEHILQAIPPETLDSWAAKVGVSHDQLATVLAQVLPHAVDHATPEGAVPPEGTPAPDLAGLLGRFLR
jgi:uncharacterized protein YidB (DUF937 family)